MVYSLTGGQDINANKSHPTTDRRGDHSNQQCQRLRDLAGAQMTKTKEEEARERYRAADDRLKAAEKTRVNGSNMMMVGGLLAAAAATAFWFADAMEIPSWVRQVILTIIAIIFSAGIVSYVVGRSDLRKLGQMADDRAGVEELLERQEAHGARLDAVEKGLAEVRDGVADVLIELVKLRQALASPGTEDAKPNGKPLVQQGLGELLDRAEFFNLGAAIERRRHLNPEDDH